MTSITVTIPSDEWVSLNTLSGISVGNEYHAMNCGTNNIYIRKGDQPSSDTKYGAILSSYSDSYALWTFESSDEEVWLKASTQDCPVYVYD